MIRENERERLINHLQNGGDAQRLSFQRLAEIMGVELSPIYIQGQKIKDKKSQIRIAAEQAGFYIENVDYINEEIQFVRRGFVVETNEERTAHEEANVQHDSGPLEVPSNWKWISGEENNYKIPFNPLTLTENEALSFFIYTTNYYLRLIDNHDDKAFLQGITLTEQLTRSKIYLNATDKYLLDPTNEYVNNQDAYIFKEMVFHTTNRGFSVKFLNFEPAIKEYLEQYNPIEFYRRVSGVRRGNALEAAEISRIRTLFNRQGEDDIAPKSFLYAAKSIARYLSNKISSFGGNRTENDLRELITNEFRSYAEADPIDYCGLFTAFKGEITCGFGEALTFDFLKEFDSNVFDLPKPDKHVKRTIVALLHHDDTGRQSISSLRGNRILINEGSIEAIQGERSCMKMYLDIIEKVNSAFRKIPGQEHIEIRNYILDKMIYMVCSGKLYLQLKQGDSNKTITDYSLKMNYLNGILNDSYKSCQPTRKNIAKVLSIL